MGVLLGVISIAAAVLLYGGSLFWFAVAVAVLNVWSYGIISNYRNDPYTPRFWTTLNILTSLAGIGFFITSFFVK